VLGETAMPILVAADGRLITDPRAMFDNAAQTLATWT